MIKLNLKSENERINGQVTYDEKDGNLDFNPRSNADILLLISYMNIGFDSIQKSANQVWGYTPKESWIKKDLLLPLHIQKGKVELEENLESGSWRLDKKEVWLTYYDLKQNWLCFGDFMHDNNDRCVEFLENVLAVVDNDQCLKSLWIKPYFK
ncbi:hypothetical protein JZO83_06835 [Enterococcus sp. DIV1298c]|uniref:Uncharacterized protein n=1 Tax=Candidatus Enterococcus mangumiae TaxID=2230878 RepID=A0ABZ2SZQ0_9ENTE|nr:MULTISPECIES: hypothetical protein [unclassified Enterococcus]MBO0461461.1 hypothetical protein [Enterococcus sp. DIV1298c]MBO0490490.1 hypothetical protein [Enterococcus sp. DIV1094]